MPQQWYRSLACAHPSLMISLATGFGLFAGSALAEVMPIHCPTDSISGAIAAAQAGSGRPYSESLSLRISGTCTENVVVPAGLTVELLGSSDAVLRPASAEEAALIVRGRGLIRNLLIRSGSPTPDTLVRVEHLAYLRIDGSEIASTAARLLVQAYGSSVVDIINSAVAGGTESAVEISNNSHAFIIATNGQETTISNPETAGGQAVGCWGGSLRVEAQGRSSSVRIGPSFVGIASRGCNSVVGGHGPGAGSVRITGTRFVGIFAKSGDQFSLVQTHVTGNEGRAIEVTAGVMEIDASVVRRNGSGLLAKRGGLIIFNDIYGKNEVGGPEPYSCYQGGRIYADRGYIEGAEPTKCLTIGGRTSRRWMASQSR
jgi:hypothetical protein